MSCKLKHLCVKINTVKPFTGPVLTIMPIFQSCSSKRIPATIHQLSESDSVIKDKSHRFSNLGMSFQVDSQGYLP